MHPETVPDDHSLERAVIAQEEAKQATARWPAGFEHAGKRNYQMCASTVMDTTDAEITFDERGVCGWVAGFETEVRARLASPEQRERNLAKTVDVLRKGGRRKPYDCIIGLSGGVDSSYLCLVAVELGLRPLVVHFDNGWNSELAVQNIERIVRKLGLDLHTFVMDWPEFRDLQRSYFKASVLDLEVPTDHMILGAIYRTAADHGVRWILSGANAQTEWLLPRSWYYPKFDLGNLKAIHRTYGTLPLKRLPAFGVVQAGWYHQVRGINSVNLLDQLVYDRLAAKRRLTEECGWRDYGGKHHESVFTRFYQSYILPTKFNIDKRKAHLSNLILAGQLTRKEALHELLCPPCDDRTAREDFSFVAKKLGFSGDEFTAVLSQPNRAHSDFGGDEKVRARYQRLLDRLAAVKSTIKRRTGTA
jgi:N-acetyl sugar amidotransferase